MITSTALAVARDHLDRLDARAPGLVTGMHVVGSAVLDDYRPGISDLDVVVELSSDADPAVLADAHTGPGVSVEAVYVRDGELDGRPDDVADGPWANLGVLSTTERSFQLNPITWLQLAGPAETVRGRRPRPHADVEAAKRFCQDNFDEYWAPLLNESKALLDAQKPDAPVSAQAIVWIALGPPRLWHTVRTGEVIGKSQAGRAAAEHWPEFKADLDDILAARAGRTTSLSVRHGLTAVAVGERVLHELSEARGSVS
ncbi:nucleotidyltransferase domain-containing protein [Allokutzneria oryzae]|uniref:Nucleotidyltransferase domain-containing protein n=1 Tax=Allokutzneria oryzae TaxID=1378989 RepID=A0ABV5ZY43_9PSEU